MRQARRGSRRNARRAGAPRAGRPAYPSSRRLFGCSARVAVVIAITGRHSLLLIVTDHGRVVVAGAGLAGLRTAEELRARGCASHHPDRRGGAASL